jgi:cytochrome c553
MMIWGRYLFCNINLTTAEFTERVDHGVKIFKWIGLSLGGMVALAGILAGALLLVANNRLTKTYPIQLETLTIPNDSVSISKGQHIAVSVCTGCHGSQLSGQAVMNAPGFAVLYAPNLTKGNGGVGTAYTTDADWIHAIRHGVDPEGKSLLLMPSEYFYFFSDPDLANLVAYLKTLPPVNHKVPDPNMAPIAKMLLGAGALGPFDVASGINHTAPRPIPPQPGVTTAYGHYLVETRICQDCHMENLAGGKNPDPSGPLVPNITPGGDLSRWSEADFTKAIRTGALPQGKTIIKGETLSISMPWRTYANLSDDELKAIWAYLQTVPAVTSKAQ